MAEADPFAEPHVDEEFWDDLLAFVEERRVVPVVGEELLTVQVEGKDMPLHRALAEALLRKYGFAPAIEEGQGIAAGTVALRQCQELNDAVCAVAQRGRRIQDLYRPVHDLLHGILGPQPSIPEPLRKLARIPAFDLFVTTTFDDLLADALDAERRSGALETAKIPYAPNQQCGDIPELRPSGYRAVVYLFGRASASPFYAIHEEDTLEFVHSLQSGRGNLPERALSEIRSRHLLLIGCTFADWLSRFFLRLSTQARLSGDRPKREFLVGRETSCDRGLTLFLQRFSQNTRIFPSDAQSFVAELARRWEERHPPGSEAAEEGQGEPEQEPGGEIFISYAHEDLPLARHLCEELRAVGATVLWFDKEALKPGDEWKPKILGAVKRCALFLPLLSATTEARTEGFFRREWNEAVERSRMIQGREFLLPVVVNPMYDGRPEGFHLAPERFRDFQFGHAPDGRLSDELRSSLVVALRDLRRKRAQ